jgi:putative membrane protein
MKGLFLKWLLLSVSVLLSAYIIEGIVVSSVLSAFFAAAILGILNTFLRPVLIIFTLPINIITFGLFTLVINALMLKMASGLIPGFHVYGFWAAVFGALVISLVNWLLNSLFREEERVEYIDLERKDGNRWE